MKLEPRSAILMKSHCEQLGWAVIWLGQASGDLQDGANGVSQVAGVPDLAPACWICGSVDLWGEGSEKGQWALPAFLSGRKLSSSSHLDARHFSSSL